MNGTNFIVICLGDIIEDAPQVYLLATRQVFATRNDALLYLGGIASSRSPLVIEGRFHQLRLPAQPMLDPNQLTREEVEALADYATIHGRLWKQDLREAWMDGRCHGILQALRNDKRFGPAGLVRFTFDSYKKGGRHV